MPVPEIKGIVKSCLDSGLKNRPANFSSFMSVILVLNTGIAVKSARTQVIVEEAGGRGNLSWFMLFLQWNGKSCVCLCYKELYWWCTGRNHYSQEIPMANCSFLFNLLLLGCFGNVALFQGSHLADTAFLCSERAGFER